MQKDLASRSPTKDGRTLSEWELVAMMATMMSCNALGIDAMLPALENIASDYAITAANDRQYVVSAYLFAAAIGALAFGPLADRYGRRPVLLASLFGGLLSMLACAVAPSFEFLLGARFVNGLFLASLPVIAQSVVRDLYEGDRMARIMSTIFMFFILAPMFAPMIGQAVMSYSSWHWIFVLLAALVMVVAAWVFLRLPETLDAEDVVPLRPHDIARVWKQVATNRMGLGYTLASGFAMGALFGYINSAQQIFSEAFNATAFFPYAFMITAGAVGVASFANSRIVERFGARRVAHSALMVFIAASVVQIALGGEEPMWLFIPILAVNMSMVGFLGSNFGSVAMRPFGHVAGAASSFQGFARLMIGASIGAFIGQYFDGTTLPLAIGFLIGGLCALLSVLFAENGKLFGRSDRQIAADAA